MEQKSRRAVEQQSSRAVVGAIQELPISSTNAYRIPINFHGLGETDTVYGFFY